MSLCFFLYLFSAAVQLGGRRRNVWFFCLCYSSCSRCPVVPQTALKSVFSLFQTRKQPVFFITRLKIDSSLFGQTPNRHKDAVGCQGRHFFFAVHWVSPCHRPRHPTSHLPVTSSPSRVRGRRGGHPESWQPNNGLLKSLSPPRWSCLPPASVLKWHDHFWFDSRG